MSVEDNVRARDEAIRRAEEHANSQWWSAAYVTGVRLSRVKDQLISEDIFNAMPPGLVTHEPRAMGSVMNALKSDGYIEPTGTYVKSPSPVGHSRPSLVWRCLRKAA